ncbi:phosphonate C-P lyase system protein PhnH [Trinickia violacea]|uniref:Phosphonate C-P lyase system protein PhnH n=1 Tax=Trinickia violacea TaxID=2571746 RepID=A0A4P8J129_9BURK|nr:phosphonate C-P lyase system protein PhnH [Trinickia violacea]QCP54035.1 phosphonate C-P lyase system protein PhnH [Trinickia violacea]
MNSPSHIALSSLTPGFADPVHDTQAVFRTLLDALARPGTIGSVAAALPESAANQPDAGRAAFATLLALADDTTPIWLATPDATLGATLRFHTGATLTDTPSRAAFAYVHDAQALPPLGAFSLGEPETPEQAATLLIRVDALTGGTPITLSGPGIETTATIAPRGLPERFWHERAELAVHFPCGIDCYLMCGDALVGLPRTTRAEVN